MTEAESAAFQAFVEGRVQGVGYRFFVEREARALGLTGYVRNLPDGRVEVAVEGAKAALDVLQERLRGGPRLAVVEHIQIIWAEATGKYAAFEARL